MVKRNIMFLRIYNTLSNTYETVVSLIQFNNGHSHIAVKGNCYIIVHSDKISTTIFKSAFEALLTLPPSPSDYLPYCRFLKDTGKRLSIVE